VEKWVVYVAQKIKSRLALKKIFYAQVCGVVDCVFRLKIMALYHNDTEPLQDAV